MIKTVYKRDGRSTSYDSNKIRNAISMAMNDIGRTELDLDAVINEVESIITNSEVKVEDLQDAIEDSLIKCGHNDVAKAYIRYREMRSNARTNNSSLIKVIKEILDCDLKSSNTLRDNGNINGATPASAMYKVGAEANKTYNLLNHIKPEYAKAHKSGDVHIHDLDYYSLTTNCLFIPLGKLLKRGFDPGNGSIRPPSSIRSAGALAAIILQSNQNNQFGGQAFDNIDFDLAPYVEKSFKRILLEELDSYLEYNSSVVEVIKSEIINEAKTLSYEDPDIHNELTNDWRIPESVSKKIIERARKKTEEETFQSMEALIFNLNSLMSRSGNQIPFSSINMGLDTSLCGRLITKCILKAVENGLGNGEIAIFPISIIKMMKGINVEECDPNYDIFNRSVDVTCRRFYPNFVSQDSTFNKPYIKYDTFEYDVKDLNEVLLRKKATRTGFYISINDLDADQLRYTRFYEVRTTEGSWREFVGIKDGKLILRSLKPETTVSTMGCRTRVIGNINGPEQTTGRGNFAFTTINLPAIAIRASRSNGDKIQNFWDDLNDKLRIAAGTLSDRYNLICKKTYQNFPFLMQNGVYLTSDEQEWNQYTTIANVLKQSTLSIGYIGIYEVCKVLLNKVLGVDEEAKEFGLSIVRHIREYCNDLQEQTHLNWSCFATPAENLCLSGDTLVQTPFGSKPIKEVKEGDVVFSYNEEKRLVELDTVINAGMTSLSSKVLKITFDDGQSLICTPDHKIAIRIKNTDNAGRIISVNGITERLEWVKASEVKVGNRVKSNYLAKNGGYLHTSTYGFVHKMVYEYYNGKIPSNHIVHHKDHNRFNNEIDNLQLMKSSDHKSLHVKDTIGWNSHTTESQTGVNNSFYGKHHSIASKQKMSESIRKGYQNGRKPHNWIDPELVATDYYNGMTIQDLVKKYHSRPGTIQSKLLSVGVSLENNHRVVKVEELDEEIPVYDLTIKNNHNFYVGKFESAILVHNCGRFCTIDKNRYGEIEDITDKGYYTNSHMLPFDLDTSLANKIATEAPFHELTNAGHIFYYKIDGDPVKNPEAVKKVILSMYRGNLGYFTITMDKDFCQDCHLEGVINEDHCPHCGSKRITRTRRITGYLVGRPTQGFDEAWNDGKIKELGRRKNI